MLFSSLSGHAESLAELHVLIPGGQGGGWDLTARTVGETLQGTGLVGRVSYENRTGNSGGVALSHLVEGVPENANTLMVNSTPIIVRSVSNIFDHTYRDLTPVAALIGDYGALVVDGDSPYRSFDELVAAFEKAPHRLRFGGGSARGDLDNIVAATIMREAVGKQAQFLEYRAYDGGGRAMDALRAGRVDCLVTGFGEAIQLQRDQQIRILGITAQKRSQAYPDVPTFAEQGYRVDFVNWRGFFAPPNLDDRHLNAYIDLFDRLTASPDWQTAMARHGWVSTYRTGKDFERFLSRQEDELLDVMRDLGIYYLGY
ncbi:tripartite tricarboxylate transporter substrate binding protein [Saccharospirillum salsuginis]|uniref:Tricarboxylic transport membrane protein n=1 Tax=Saccharospirillum salsuginis TaxID=418750 RepID=A0A918K4K5_9GAMM|nr:tripartite tricarboxylate transporter substrate-binding protein [Saccharospirillum salsuginis]GGX48841.1 hypothetical protein GCM10007392_15040 [Saccharospirillum salsuginis]